MVVIIPSWIEMPPIDKGKMCNKGCLIKPDTVPENLPKGRTQIKEPLNVKY